jgi:hypothetical protein
MKTKPQSDEYRAFENLLGRVLTVSKAELDKRLKKEEHEKHTPKHASRAPAVSSKVRQLTFGSQNGGCNQFLLSFVPRPSPPNFGYILTTIQRLFLFNQSE